jgi:hypothetical protein
VIGLTCGRGGGSDGEESGDGQRRGSGSTAAAARVAGEKPAMLGHHVRLGAQVGAREEQWVTGLPRARAERGVHRRR